MLTNESYVDSDNVMLVKFPWVTGQLLRAATMADVLLGTPSRTESTCLLHL